MAFLKITSKLLLAAATATLCAGCVVGVSTGDADTKTINMGQPIRVPAGTRLIAYGKHFPATMVPGPGTLYFFNEETGSLAYVLTLNDVVIGEMMLLKDLPPEAQENFEPERHYRVYFAGRPTTRPAAGCPDCDANAQ
jgi:hypothetical protein